MRILIFSTAYFPMVGGAEVAVKEITARLPEHDFVLITARLKPEFLRAETIGRVKIVRVGNGSGFDKIRLWINGWKAAREHGKFDMVWGIMASYGGLAALRWKKKNPLAPFLLTLQEGDSHAHIYGRAFFVWPWFGQIFRRADSIQAISNYLAEWGKKMGAKCSVSVVPNGATFFADRYLSELTKEMALAINFQIEKLNSEDKLILSVSRLVKKNGLEYLIRSMQYLPKNYKLRIVGEGNLRSRLDKIIQKLELSDRVFLRGEVPFNQVMTYYQKAQVFVRPSLSEGLGNVFLEAIHLGKPVIGTRVGGIPDFLEDGKTGWFCKIKNPKDIAEKIQYVLDEHNSAAVETVKQRAREMVLKKYTWEVIAPQMNKIFNSLCAS